MPAVDRREQKVYPGASLQEGGVAVSTHAMKNAMGRPVTYRLPCRRSGSGQKQMRIRKERRQKRTGDQKITGTYTAFAVGLAAARVRHETRRLSEDHGGSGHQDRVRTGRRGIRLWTTGRDLAFHLMLLYALLSICNMWPWNSSEGAEPADELCLNRTCGSLDYNIAGVPFDPDGLG